MIAFFDPVGPTGRTFGVVPLVALAATVTKHTLSIGPFILRETDQVDELSWDDGQSR